MHAKTVIIGSGPAGYTAALYAARANLSPVMIMGNCAGGQLLYTHKIENFPGFTDISGSALIDIFHAQAEQLHVSMIYEKVEKVDLAQTPFLLYLSDKKCLTASSVIIACGAEAKWLNVPGENQFKGHGISVCATCDGYFYKNAKVAVIGGGNTALYEALFLSSLAQHVSIINKGDHLIGENTLIKKVLDTPNITVLNNSEVVEFTGTGKLSGIRIKQSQTIKNIPISGAFIAIGQKPVTDLFCEQIRLDADGFIVTDEAKQTSVAGVFAAGDVQEKHFRQAIVACASGAVAALSAEKYLADL